MVDHEPPVQVSDFKDCKTGLVVFGILEIVLGAYFALMLPFVIFMKYASSHIDEDAAAHPGSSITISVGLFYVLLAVWFIWMGLGSMNARRWARSLLLVTSWIWLIWGTRSFIVMLVYVLTMNDQMTQGGEIPREMGVFIKLMMFGSLAVAFMIIPGALILFYGRKNVKATCELRDPKVRWTDKCPLPILAVSLMCGLSAGSMVMSGFNGWAIPFFGLVLTGVVGAGVSLVGVLLLCYAAWGTYKLSMKGWWCTVLLTIVWTISMGITYMTMGMSEYSEKMNPTKQQPQYDMLSTSTMSILLGAWAVGFLGYLLYTRRYFLSPSAQEGVS